MNIDRRQFLQFAGIGGVVFASGLAPAGARSASGGHGDFYFVQLSDTHWGFKGAALNPDAEGTLPKAVAAVNELPTPPDFVVFTGDLTHLTPDPVERRRRLNEFKTLVGALKTPQVRFMPGEHDATIDHGEAYREIFGETHYAFEHKGMLFIALDNVSDPQGQLGEEQLHWLGQQLAKRRREQPIVIFTHRPLFDLAPEWEWTTKDGGAALELLMPFENVNVFYGHIHQEHHHLTGHIAHHAAKSLIFPLPAPGSQSERKGLPWDPLHPYQGLGFRQVATGGKTPKFDLQELPVPFTST